MTRFFFDLTAGQSPRYDYRGCMLKDLDQARARAELLAMDLSCCEPEPQNAAIVVRDAHGRTLLSVSLPAVESIAA
jgi:hypothetical protein